jgi:hypothetical protein
LIEGHLDWKEKKPSDLDLYRNNHARVKSSVERRTEWRRLKICISRGIRFESASSKLVRFRAEDATWICVLRKLPRDYIADRIDFLVRRMEKKVPTAR